MEIRLWVYCCRKKGLGDLFEIVESRVVSCGAGAAARAEESKLNCLPEPEP
jgi:hypothetical protein